METGQNRTAAAGPPPNVESSELPFGRSGVVRRTKHHPRPPAAHRISIRSKTGRTGHHPRSLRANATRHDIADPTTCASTPGPALALPPELGGPRGSSDTRHPPKSASRRSAEPELHGARKTESSLETPNPAQIPPDLGDSHRSGSRRSADLELHGADHPENRQKPAKSGNGTRLLAIPPPRPGPLRHRGHRRSRARRKSSSSPERRATAPASTNTKKASASLPSA